MKASPNITSFNAGEFSGLMAGRADIKYYNNACRKIRNFIPTPQGPARRRGSTRYVTPIKGENDRSWLIRFVFNVEQAYVLEFGDLYIRFFANHAPVMDPTDPLNPLEVTTPYTVADLTDADGTCKLRFVQSNDVLYLVHRGYRPKELRRLGAAEFELADFDFKGGPFEDIDPDQTVTVYIDNGEVGAGRTLTASAAIFEAEHVGGLFLLEQNTTDDTKQWESGKGILVNDVRRSDGKNYKALNATNTGSVKPVHTVGARYDGDAGVQWQYLDAGFGWGEIKSIGGGGTTAIVDVLSRIPDEATGAGNASTRWAFGSWSDKFGWPDEITFFLERLCLFRDQLAWGSESGSFNKFRDRDESGLVTKDMAFKARIEDPEANRIRWALPSDVALLIGTAGSEHAIYAITSTEAFGPGNARAKRQSAHGSQAVRPQSVGDGVLFAQRFGRKIRDMRQVESVEQRWASTDTTILASHVMKSGVIDMAYQQDPDSVLWCLRADFQPVGFTLDRDQDVRGWHPHRIGGYADVNHVEFAAVESLTVIPRPDNDGHEVWAIVRRYINGQTRRYVEYMEKVRDEGDDPQDVFFVDSGLTLDNTIAASLAVGAGADVEDTEDVPFAAGAPIFVVGDVGRFIHYRYSTVNVTGKVDWHLAIVEITEYVDASNVKGTINSPFPSYVTSIASGDWRMTVTAISGLDHLEGEVVQVCADGAAHPDRTVTAGAIELQEPASKVHVGYQCTAVLQPMPLEAGAADGPAQGKTKRISRCIIRFLETLGAKYGRDEDSANLDEVLTRSGDENMDEPPPLFTGDKVVAWPDGYDGDALITIVQDQPLPCTVVMLAPQVTTQDNR